MKKNLLNALWIIFLGLLLLGIPKLSGAVASLFNYQSIDPDGSYAWISVHHLVQALIFLAIMVVIGRNKQYNFGFGWGDQEKGRKYVLLFCLFFTIYTTGAFVVIFITNSFQPFQFPMTAINIAGQLGFQLLLSGPSEELIFRAFAITMLTAVINKRLIGNRVSMANIIAAIIFGLAHISFSFAPFAISYHLSQVFYAAVLGIFYGDCYEKTGSMFYPMMMHSFTNVLMVGTTIILSF